MINKTNSRRTQDVLVRISDGAIFVAEIEDS